MKQYTQTRGPCPGHRLMLFCCTAKGIVDLWQQELAQPKSASQRELREEPVTSM